MFERLGKIFLAVTLMTNIVLGCAMMPDAQRGQNATSSTANHSTHAKMAGCHEDMGRKQSPKDDHQVVSPFCKSFCLTLMASLDAYQTNTPQYAVPEKVVARFTTSWESGVDPPHPRSFIVAI